MHSDESHFVMPGIDRCGLGRLGFADFMRPHRFALAAAALFSIAGSLPAQAPRRTAAAEEPAEHRLTASLDAILDWAAPLSLTKEKMQAAFKGDGFKTSPYYSWSEEDSAAGFGRRPYRNIEVGLTMLDGKAPVERAEIRFKNGQAESFSIELGEVADSTVTEPLAARLGVQDSLRSVSTEAGAAKFAMWKRDGFVIMHASGGRRRVMARLADGHAAMIEAPGTAGTIRIARPDAAATSLKHDLGGAHAILCDLDFLFEFPAAWQMAAEQLDRRFDVAGEGFAKNPFFEWLTTAKERARFSRKPFSNVTVDLRIFGGKVSVDEAVVDFKEGRPSLVSLSVYNRGDSGGMGVAEFESYWKACGKAIGDLLKAHPRQQQPAGNAVRTIGWLWQSQVCVALMEYNDYTRKGSQAAMPEFLRIKLAPPANRDWNFGSSGFGSKAKMLDKASLAKNVAKTADGDLYVRGVPMVDQGDKGYCVVASCQRLFEYFHIACDQHEMAQLFGSDADRGTSSLAMEQALGKIDTRYSTNFKPLIGGSLSRERNYQPPGLKKFNEMLKRHIGEGIPLLWALQLGRAPENPPLPAVGQVSGGHMRMIIGCNEAKGEVIFTDSWGAGHELKRMKAADALAVTDGLYVMQPRM